MRALPSSRTRSSASRRFVADASHELKAPIAAIRAARRSCCTAGRHDPDAREAALSSLDRWRAALRGARRPGHLARLDREPPTRRARAARTQVALEVVREAQPLRPEVAIRIERLDEARSRATSCGCSSCCSICWTTRFGSARPARPWAWRHASDARASNAPSAIADRASHLISRAHLRSLLLARAARGRATGGVGLGLAIARKIAEDHGGSLSASPAVGGGAVFTATLPLPRLIQPAPSP